MDKKEYPVSEAVRLIGVESHVLRYWEEELQIEIRRSSQGHRLYSAENIEMFRRVKELKEKGLQLKAIRLLMDESGRSGAAPASENDGFARQLREFAGTDMPWGRSEERSEARTEARGEEWGEARTERQGDEQGEGRAEGQSEEESKARTEAWGEERSEAGGGERWEDQDGETEEVCCEIVPLPERDDDMYQFRQILRRLIEEVVTEQNEKLEEALAGRMKEEFEDFYLQCYQSMQEAAASLGAKEKKHNGMMGALRRLLRPER